MPNKNLKGFFITFEGIEGVGKSTQIKLLSEFLKQKKLKVKVTKEPGGTKIGKQIRKILLNPKNINMTPLSELFLLLADRTQHIEEIIFPLLKNGYIVISDRFFDSTFAYQIGGRGLNPNLVKKLNAIAIKNLKPDLTFLLETDKLETITKAKQLSKEYANGDRIENESLSFYKKIQQAYKKLAKNEPERIVRIKLKNKISETQSIIQKICIKYLTKNRII